MNSRRLIIDHLVGNCLSMLGSALRRKNDAKQYPFVTELLRLTVVA
jgi:hypothetical protein